MIENGGTAPALPNVAEVVANATEKAIKMAEPLMGKKEAASYLGFSVTTLERRMAESDGPPRYTDGGRVSFLRSELRV
jgi:predicted DNA-binding transcriptional regulator AlpA